MFPISITDMTIFLQYAPLAAVIGLKLGGVESRSSWPRLLVSDILAAGIMATAVNSMKYTIKRERPDGSKNNSFPSGHTATAFMAATIMHREYGLTRSPLYSIGGYTVATATAFSRQLNNRHWLSDVLAGARYRCPVRRTGLFPCRPYFQG